MSMFIPLSRCVACVRNEPILWMGDHLELCRECALKRLTPIEPGYEVILEVVPCGYDVIEEIMNDG